MYVISLLQLSASQCMFFTITNLSAQRTISINGHITVSNRGYRTKSILRYIISFKYPISGGISSNLRVSRFLQKR